MGTRLQPWTRGSSQTLRSWLRVPQKRSTCRWLETSGFPIYTPTRTLFSWGVPVPISGLPFSMINWTSDLLSMMHLIRKSFETCIHVRASPPLTCLQRKAGPQVNLLRRLALFKTPAKRDRCSFWRVRMEKGPKRRVSWLRMGPDCQPLCKVAAFPLRNQSGIFSFCCGLTRWPVPQAMLTYSRATSCPAVQRVLRTFVRANKDMG